MQSVIDRLQLPGTGVSCTGYALGVPYKDLWTNAEDIHFYTRLPVKGDGFHATPYKHIKFHVSGRVHREFMRDIGWDRAVWVYDGYDDYPRPMPSSMPGVSVDSSTNEVFLAPPSELRAAVDNKLLERLAQQKFALGESLGEVVETSRFIVEKTAHLMRVLVDLKHGRFSEALKQLGIRESYMRKDVAHRWLEAQFAIKPLIGEIEQARELAGFQLDTRTTLSVAAYKRQKRYHLFTAHETPAVADVGWKCRGFITADVNLSHLRALMQLGLGNAPSILWELLPLSWLVDYVSNVGDLIAGFGATRGLTFSTGCYSDKIEASASTLPNLQRYPGNPRYTFVYTGFAECTGFQRVPFYDFPWPKVEWKLPLDATKMANIAALVRVFLIGSRS